MYIDAEFDSREAEPLAYEASDTEQKSQLYAEDRIDEQSSTRLGTSEELIELEGK